MFLGSPEAFKDYEISEKALARVAARRASPQIPKEAISLSGVLFFFAGIMIQ